MPRLSSPPSFRLGRTPPVTSLWPFCSIAAKAPSSASHLVVPVTDIQIELHQCRIDYAQAIGADAYGLVGGGRLRGRAPTVEEYAQLADFCEGLSHYGNPRGIVVAYHPHVGTTVESSPEIRQLLGRTEALRLCLNISHVALVGEYPLQAMAEFWDRIGYFHLKYWARGRFHELCQGPAYKIS